MAAPESRPIRRRLLVAGVGAAAALVGAGVAWRRLQPASTADTPDASLWTHRFASPEGGFVELSSFRGRPLLINFWATWCPPCVDELPLLDTFFRQNAASGWNVVGLAIDQPSSVRQFLARTPVSFPIGFAGLEGTGLGKSLGNTSGGLPFTVVFGADGAVRHRKMGQISKDELIRWRGEAGA